MPPVGPLAYTHVAAYATCQPLSARQPPYMPKVNYYIDYFLSGNRQLAFPGTLHVAVLGDLTPDQHAARGNLKSATPEEQRHALVLAIGRNIADGQSDAELQRWRTCILSAVVTFTKYDTDDDLFWAATNHREPIGAQYEVVYYSTVDR